MDADDRAAQIRERHAEQRRTGLCACGNELEDPRDDHCVECDF